MGVDVWLAVCRVLKSKPFLVRMLGNADTSSPGARSWNRCCQAHQKGGGTETVEFHCVHNRHHWDGRCFVAQEEKDPIQLVPIFGLPLRLADWAYMENWSWQSPHLTEIFKRAVEGGLAWSSTLTWVGHPEVFSRPAVSFFTLLRLEEDLEEHGYHMFALPILALHCQLANAFQSPVKEAVACTAKLRLLRMAGECRLRQAVGQLREEVTKELNDIPETFDSFKEAGEFGQYTVQLRKWWWEFYNCLGMLRPFRPLWKMRMSSLLLSIPCISVDHNLSFESGKFWEKCFKTYYQSSYSIWYKVHRGISGEYRGIV